MNLVSREVEKYCIEHSNVLDELLLELERETNLRMLAPQMLSGHIQGKFLALLTQLHKPQKIVEIGTYTGYATLCFALSLPDNGQVDTIEINEELAPIIHKYLSKAKVGHLVNLHIGDALDILPKLDGPFDMAFIDAGKIYYAQYYDLLIDKMNPGAIIIADNTLWSGKVAGKDNSKDTQTLRAFNQQMFDDPRIDVTIFPFRDGLSIATVL